MNASSIRNIHRCYQRRQYCVDTPGQEAGDGIGDDVEHDALIGSRPVPTFRLLLLARAVIARNAGEENRSPSANQRPPLTSAH
jgi:hypothetical protein